MKHVQLQRWIFELQQKDATAKYAVRITVIDLRVRVRVESMEKLGEAAPGADEIFVGPFKDAEEVDREGRVIAQMVRRVFGLEKQ